MSKLVRSGSLLLFCALLISMSFSSCVSTKKYVYFNNLPDTILASNPVVIDSVTPFKDPVILPNDILAITLQTMVQNQTNMPITTNQMGIFNPLNGFLVDKNGNIELSLIGFVKVGGLTTSEARELIKEKAKEYFKEPVVNVRIANFDVFLLGEVAQKVVNVPSEKLNILELLANSGDLLITGKRENVLLIRTEGNTKKFVRFDLTKTDLFKSPYFYMRQRDVVYIEPNKYKIQINDNNFQRILTIVSSLASLSILLLSLQRYK